MNNDNNLYGMEHTQTAQQIGIHQLGFHLPQLYYNPNGTLITLVTQGFLALRNGMISIGVGCSSRLANQEEDYQVMLWEAQHNAMQQAFLLANISLPVLIGAFQGAPAIGINSFSDQNALVQNGVEHTNPNKDVYQGGGSKPISTAQKSMIMTMCSERTIDYNELCLGICKKTLEHFNGADADKLIKHLKSSRQYRKSTKN